jgi:hypothetical protein
MPSNVTSLVTSRRTAEHSKRRLPCSALQRMRLTPPGNSTDCSSAKLWQDVDIVDD